MVSYSQKQASALDGLMMLPLALFVAELIGTDSSLASLKLALVNAAIAGVFPMDLHY
jgi:hypothetical protein